MKKKYRIFSVLPALCVMVGIFCFSSQDASKSSELSGGVVTQMFGLIEGTLHDNLGITNSQAWFEIIETVIRKIAHMSEYAMLALTVYFPFYVYGKRGKNSIFWCEVVCVIYAMTDEFHQLFVPGRSGQITDVLIDGCGAFIGCLIIHKISTILHKQ